ncbi:MAG TPA: hypothetical protein VLM37_12695 [Fibrobacteraceae bacterium]|nr:hypothetical protein [Fibrobacteraceae bacterium]
MIKRPLPLVFSLCAFFLAVSGWSQDNPRGEFYLKEQVKGFISLKMNYERFSSNAINGVNDLAFNDDWGWAYAVDSNYNEVSMNSDDAEDTLMSSDASSLDRYKRFGPNIPGFGVDFGAQYHQFNTWISAFFIPVQESKAPVSDRRDVQWYRYGFDWMFGWMLAPENSFVNIIPSVGAGISLLKMRFAANYNILYPYAEDDEMVVYTMGNRYYSAFGKSATAQVELRFNLAAGISVGAFAGGRYTWYDHMVFETESEEYFAPYTELSGNSWFIGGKITYTMKSIAEKKKREKL